jgi:tetratricopeptide (TPR) repeat protein
MPVPSPPEASIEEAARHYRERDLPATERCCRAILTHQPRHFDALHLLGVVCIRTDRHAEAVDHLSRAAAERADNAQLWLNLGNAHQGLHQHPQAIEAYERALALNAGDPGLLNNLGSSLRQLGRTDEAIGRFRQVLVLHPDHAPAHNNLAAALADADQLEAAVVSYRRALAAAPADTPPDRLASVVNGLGKVLLDLGRLEEALAACRDLQARYPDLNVVEWNASLALLLQGAYAEGWPKYEARWQVPEHDAPHPDMRVLDLATVAGQRVLVTGEQGRGDIIQFARYAPLLAECGAIVTLSVYPDLVALMRTMPGVAAVIGDDEPDPAYDQRTPLLSLPLAFGTELATVPNQVPYLWPPDDRLALSDPRDRPRVGVVWSGSMQSRARSAIPPCLLGPLLQREGVEFHVLQKDMLETDRAWLETQPGVMQHSDALGDFADTAALIMQMDLVITIDTAVAHLAGALARPVWIMLPFNPDWRWLVGRDDSPWYPTARLFRQVRRRDWGGVVQRVVAALDRWLAVAAHPGRTPR